MGNQSIFTEVSRELMDEVRAAREQAEKSKTPPFMTEDVRRRDALSRFERMTQGERKEYAESNRDEVLKVLRSRRDG